MARDTRDQTQTMKTSIDRGKAVKAKKRGSAFAAALLLAALATLAFAGLASAKDLYLYEFEKSFNGSDSNVGAMTSTLLRVAVNNENGHVYVLDEHNGKGDVTQFNENGQAAFWSALGGTNAIELESSIVHFGSSEADIAFDNATGHHWGLFVFNNFASGYIRAYNADGTVRLPGFPQSYGTICGLGFSRDNGLYVGGAQFASRFNPETGARIESGLEGSPWAEGGACHTVWDLENESWLPEDGEHTSQTPGLQKYGNPSEINFGYPNFARPKITVQPGPGGSAIKRVQMADIDEGNDTIFAIEDGKENAGPAQVLQVSQRGQPMLSFGAGTIHQANGIAVNSNNHKVYVTSDSPTPRVDIFKRNPTPVTVPDAETLSGRPPERNHRHPPRRSRSGRRWHHHRLPLRLGSRNYIRIRHAALQGGWERNEHHLEPDGSDQRGLEPDPRQPVPLPRCDEERERLLVLWRRPALRGVDASHEHAPAGRKDQH